MSAETYNISSVFISYSRRDSDFTHRLDEAFREYEMEVWVDYEDIPLSVDWWEEIEAGIEGANVFVFIISPDSVMSEICRKEIDYAFSHNKRFIPVLHRDLNQAEHGDHVHPAVTSHNWLFFREDDNFDESFKKLVETIEADFDHIRAHTRLLVRAREWETNNRDASYLLKGTELDDAEAWLAAGANKMPEPTLLQTEYVYESEQARRRQQRLLLGGVSVALVIALGLAALSFYLFQESQRNLQTVQAQNIEIQQQSAEIAEQNNILEENNIRIISQQNQIEENLLEISSVSLALNAQQNFDEGDTFRALPFALASFETKNTGISERTLADIAYNPGPRTWLFDHSGAIADIATHPQTMQAASASWDNTVRLWDMQTGELNQTLDAHEDRVLSVAFSADGERLFSGDRNRRIHIWDTADGSLLNTWTERSAVIGLATSTDDSRIIVATPTYVRVRDATSGETRYQSDDFAAPVTEIALAPDNRQLLIGLDNGNVLEWLLPADDMEDRTKPPQPFADYTGRITSLAISEAGDGVLVAASQRLDYLNQDGELLDTFEGHTNIITDIAFSPNGETAVSVSHDRTMILWEIEDGDVLRVFSGHQGLPEHVAISHNGLRALSGSVNGSLILWDMTVDTLQTVYPAPTGNLRGLAVNATGDSAITTDAGGVVRLWNLADGTSRELGQQDGEGYDVVFINEDTEAISAGVDGLYLWDVSTETTDPVALEGHDDLIFDLALNQDGTRLLSAGLRGHIVLWDTTTKEPLQTYENLTGLRILAVGFGSDGTTGFLASNTRVYRFNLDDGTLITQYTGHQDSVLGMDISPDGEMLLTGDIKGRLILWDIESAEQLFVMEAGGEVWSTVFDPSGDVIAAGEASGETSIWRVETGQAIRTYDNQDSRVRGLAFTPGGERLILGNENLVLLRFFKADDLAGWVANNRLAEYLNCSIREEFRVEPLCRDETQGRAEPGSQEAELPLAVTHLWAYRGQAGETIIVEMNARQPSNGIDNAYEVRELGLLNPALVIRDSNGIPLVQSDETVTAVANARLEITLPDDALYTIEAGSSRSESSGHYDLTIESDRQITEDTSSDDT